MVVSNGKQDTTWHKHVEAFALLVFALQTVALLAQPFCSFIFLLPRPITPLVLALLYFLKLIFIEV